MSKKGEKKKKNPRCRGTTQKTVQCKRRTDHESGFCESHRPKETPPTTTLPFVPLANVVASTSTSQASVATSQHSPVTPPTNDTVPPAGYTTSHNAVSGSNIGDNADLPTLPLRPLANVVEEGNSTYPVVELGLASTSASQAFVATSRRRPVTPPKNATVPSADFTTPVNAVSGSNIGYNADLRRFPMAADLAHRSYTSSMLLDAFLEGIPEVTPQHTAGLHGKQEWTDFIESCTDGRGNSSTHKSSGSNEKEFKALVQCIASLEDLRKYFEKPQENTQNEREIRNPRRGCIRISHQGNSPMTTWNPAAGWLRGNYGSTSRQNELKPDFVSIVVEDAKLQLPGKSPRKLIQLAKPQTILPPPVKWKPKPMDDKDCPMVECKEPVWECLDLFWELKRNSEALNEPKVYVDCALKAAEALRYQWSRRYVYCFLHCGSKMQLLHFDRSGLVASDVVDIVTHTDKFIKCLLGVFCHAPSRLGYPAGEAAPFHMCDRDNRLRQVVTVGHRQLYLYDQEAGPPRDHLVSRATVTFKAKLVNAEGEEEAGRDWCYKSSWPQKLRKHEGDYLSEVQDLPNVVKLLVHGVVKVENDNDDTTVFGRGQCSSGEPMTLLEKYYNEAKRMKHDFNQHTGTAGSGQDDLRVILYDPRRPEAESWQECDDREHRDIVTAWISSSFDEAISSVDSLSTIFSIWQQAFSAIKEIAEKRIVHRDISFRNIRVDEQHKVKVCDFDMAMSLDNGGAGVQDRTGTIAFMAASILNSLSYKHRPIHDFESIFWLCALDLLVRIGGEGIKSTIADIMDSGNTFSAVSQAKLSLFPVLESFESGEEESELGSYVTFNKPKDSSLFFCLTALMREFSAVKLARGYRTVQDGTDDVVFFDRCIDIIQQALDADGQQVTKGIAAMSLS